MNLEKMSKRELIDYINKLEGKEEITLHYLNLSENKNVQHLKFKNFDKAVEWVKINGLTGLYEHGNQEFIDKI